MIVYADVLIVLNLTVDFFLLSAASVILRRKVSALRITAAAFLGGACALYIFIPSVSIFADFIIKLIICVLMSLIAFGYQSFKQFLKSVFAVFTVTCGYAGIMIAVWHIFKPHGMLINNSVVYFDISPLVLVGATAVSYFAFVFLSAIFKRSAATAKMCNITLFAGGSRAELSAIVDTGNSLNDAFGKSEVIIADRSVAESLFGETDPQKNEFVKPRYRVVPCGTVSGSDMLEGFRCDSAKIENGGRSITLQKPILAVSKLPLNDGYNAIINPKILD